MLIQLLRKKNVIIDEFQNINSTNSIILNIITIILKSSLNILINSFRLIVCFRVKRD